MRRVILLLFGVAVTFWACGDSSRPSAKQEYKSPPSANQYRLIKDFPYAQQVDYVQQKDAPFVREFGRIEEKKFESLIQKQPGSISFPLHLYGKPVLKYSIQFQERNTSDLEVGLSVESDYPEKTVRHFQPLLNQVNAVDLSEFAGRVVLITLSARSRNPDGLGGTVTWVNPVIEQATPKTTINADQLQPFRDRQKGSNVLIFLFDAAGASHVGAYGYSRPTTPVIDSIASDGILWKNAFSQAVSTRASTGTLFTGVLPGVHKVLKKPTILKESFKTMAECFQEVGFETALFTANPNASEVAGFGQGFRYSWNLRKGGVVEANEVVPFVNRWLDQVKDRRFFGYVHFREPHEPYTPPAGILARFTSEPDFRLPYFEAYVPPPDKAGIQKVITAYDANLAFADEQFGLIIQHLKQTGLYENTILVVIADHGEAFWAHGKQGHNSQVYEDMIHIPMIMRFPRSPELKGVRPEQLVGTIDLFPTFADLFQFSKKGIHLSGESLISFLVQGRKEPDRMMVSETSSQDAYALRSREFKYIHYRSDAGKAEFYHLLSDPGEKRNVIGEYPALSSYYRSVLLNLLDENKVLASRLNAGPEATAVIDAETEEELRALGYVN